MVKPLTWGHGPNFGSPGIWVVTNAVSIYCGTSCGNWLGWRIKIKFEFASIQEFDNLGVIDFKFSNFFKLLFIIDQIPFSLGSCFFQINPTCMLISGK